MARIKSPLAVALLALDRLLLHISLLTDYLRPCELNRTDPNTTQCIHLMATSDKYDSVLARTYINTFSSHTQEFRLGMSTLYPCYADTRSFPSSVTGP